MSTEGNVTMPAFKRVIAPLNGGLGNQLFQCTHAQVLFSQAIAEERLCFDNSWFTTDAINAHEVVHKQLEAALPAPVKCLPAPKPGLAHKLGLRASEKSLGSQLDSGLHYELVLSYDKHRDTARIKQLSMDGECINEPAAKAFLKKVKEQTSLNTAYTQLQSRLRQANGFATLHIRRGDYLKVASFMPAMAYYERALELLERFAPGIELWIHSDDIVWCKSQPLFQRANCHFLEIDGESDALQEMLVLGEARYVIMANSTFSWWISAFARICQPSYERSIMPSRWFNNGDISINPDFHRSDILALRAWD